MQIKESNIFLDIEAASKEEAIFTAGEKLMELGFIEQDYTRGMLKREQETSTFIGNGFAIPHGTKEALNLVKETGVVILRLKQKIAWGDDEVNIVVAVAANSNEHINILQKIAHISLNPNSVQQLNACKNSASFTKIINGQAVSEEEILSLEPTIQESAPRPEETALGLEQNTKPQNTKNKGFIIGVCACPAGIAHTYMAQEALTQTAQRLGLRVKIETQGSVGTENELTDEEIKEADFVIIAADIHVDKSRFEDKKIYETSIGNGVKNSERTILEAIKDTAVLPKQISNTYEKTTKTNSKSNAISALTDTYKHLLNGVSFMLPLVTAGGILIALSFAFGIEAFKVQGSFAEVLMQIGSKSAFGLMLPVLAGYIAFSIAGKPGLAPGLVGGILAANGGSGFLGALIGGFLAGYLVVFLKKQIKLPQLFAGLMPVLILPLLSVLGVGVVMIYLLSSPISAVMSHLIDFLNALNGTNMLFLGVILGSMMAFDLGGPLNKAAYIFAISLLDQKIYEPMAAVMAGGMTPPLGIFSASLIAKNRFTPEEQEAAKPASILGLSFITEGAIAFAAKDPLRVLPALMLGSATASTLSLLFGCELKAPHGGIFVLPIPNVIENLPLYILSILVGVLTTAITLVLLKRKIYKVF